MGKLTWVSIPVDIYEMAAMGLLSEQDLGSAMAAVGTYWMTGALPEGLSQHAMYVFTKLQEGLENSIKKYEVACERNRRIGEKRAAQRGLRAIPAAEGDPMESRGAPAEPSGAHMEPSGFQMEPNGFQVESTTTQYNTRQDNTTQYKQYNTTQDTAPAGPAPAGMRPPTVEEVRGYCAQIHSSVDPERFVDHYTSTGWMSGGSPIRDWRARIRMWEKRQPRSAPPQPKGADEISRRAIAALMAEEILD